MGQYLNRWGVTTISVACMISGLIILPMVVGLCRFVVLAIWYFEIGKLMFIGGAVGFAIGLALTIKEWSGYSPTKR